MLEQHVTVKKVRKLTWKSIPVLISVVKQLNPELQSVSDFKYNNTDADTIYTYFDEYFEFNRVEPSPNSMYHTFMFPNCFSLKINESGNLVGLI